MELIQCGNGQVYWPVKGIDLKPALEEESFALIQSTPSLWKSASVISRVLFLKADPSSPLNDRR